MKAPRIAILVAAVALSAGLAVSTGCSTPIPNRVPVGEVFPTAMGESLEKEAIEIPADWLGSPTVVLIGYEQEAQFDADRWLLGLLQAELDVRIVELPTIPSAIASLFSGTIDEGMRGGIPPEDWASVVTVYGSAAKPIAEFTGNEKNRNMRVALLDSEGRVVWFHDEGYSARELLDMKAALGAL